GSPPPSASASPASTRVATRVVIEQLGIDLPIIAQPNPNYPSCNVAMYYQDPRLGQPGSGRSVYIYAHAPDGIVGPLYERVIPQIQSIRRRSTAAPRASTTTPTVTSQKPPASAPLNAVPASLIPKIPATAPIPARMTVTPVSRFMIRDRSLLTIET